MVLLVGYDMYATFMVLPWLPVVWVGIARTLDATENTRPLIVSTAALALVWYAHPAVAAWLTPVWLSALVVRAVLVEKKFHRFLPPLLATAALGWLIAYLFVSVSSLALTYSINIHGDAARAIVSNLQLAGRAAWLPMVNPIGTLGNIQLGYALTVLGLTCLIGVRRSRLPAIFFAAVSVAFFVLLFPLPGLTHAFWSLAPNALVNATNVWPMQRFYPILAAAFPVWAALVLRTYEPCNRTRRIIICALVVGVAWSFWQAEKPRHHAEIVSQSPKASSQLLAPVNVALARSSYLMFDFYPAYYSHGVMEPTFETRLLDSAMNVILENTSALAALKSDTVPVATLKPLLIVSRYADVRRREATFETDGHSQYLLAFTFNGTPNGDIELFGGGLNRHYVLPEFGSAQAFGAGQHSSPYLPICMPPGPPAKITLRTEIPDLVARVFPFHPDELPIQTRSLIPLEISARASQAGFVETPKVFIPGYTATVNGVTTEVIRSHEGLVAVPVLAGPVEVVVRYQGPVALRLAFWFSFAGFALLPLCAVWLWGRSLEKNWLQPAREAP